jgi:ubiquitin-conjugating enzyme E2 Z
MSNKKKNKIYIKRIISDISEISSDYDPKIHIWYDENNITKIRALIIGPESTPYEDGFFFFTIDIPETYPFNHPSAKFETINKQIRFNPNLYEEGKVCLSIIGTWSGPKWSSVQTLKSLLLSIQSLLDETPINNEPSYEQITKDDKRSIEYNEYIRFNTYSFAIYEMLTNNTNFPFFNDVIEKYFVENYDRIRSKLVELKVLDGQIMKTFIWSRQVKIDYSELINKFDELHQKLKIKDFSDKKSSVHVSNPLKLSKDI